MVQWLDWYWLVMSFPRSVFWWKKKQTHKNTMSCLNTENFHVMFTTEAHHVEKVIAFLPRSKHLLISWLQSPSAVILEPKKIKSVTISIVSPSICHEVMGPDAMIFVFWMLSFKPTFHSPLSLSSRGSLVLFTFCHKGGVICISKVIDISPSNLDSSLCFIQSSISHDVLCIEVK